MVVGCLCRYTCWKHMLPMPDERMAHLIFLFKKRLSNVQHFRLPVLRCEGLFICGTLFLLVIAQESQSVTLLSLSVSHKFFKRYPPNTRHLAGWLQSRNQWRSLRVSQSFLIIHSVTPHMFKPMHLGRSSSIDRSRRRRDYWRAGVGRLVQRSIGFVCVYTIKKEQLFLYSAILLCLQACTWIMPSKTNIYS